MSDENLSYINLENVRLIEDLHAQYKNNPDSVPEVWRGFFQGVDFIPQKGISAYVLDSQTGDLRVFYLVNAYRKFGHLYAKIRPIRTEIEELPSELDHKTHHFTDSELETSFPSLGFCKGEKAPLSEIIRALQKTYCGSIGVEYMGLGDYALEEYVQERIEPGFSVHLTNNEKKEVLHSLNKADLFETFLHRKFVGQKRFSLEGGESLIPMLQTLIEKGGDRNLSHLIIGMAHRGRLNVLANILKKSYEAIFTEFEGKIDPSQSEGVGDVKYHKGYDASVTAKSGNEVKITLCENPSHLEAVDPVTLGMARSIQDQMESAEAKKGVLPVLIHGDAALAGQGVVYESLQFCRIKGYETRGTVHIVVNNQIGFTAKPSESRSTRYCTDIAKAFGAPVFHLNGEEPEKCVYATILALKIREHFGCDVFLDLNCYRKHGHNEGDEPAFTQPLEYKVIGQHPAVRTLYRDELIRTSVITAEEAKKIEAEFKADLQKALDVTKQDGIEQTAQKTAEIALNFEPKEITSETLKDLAKELWTLPESLKPHPKVQKLMDKRQEAVLADNGKIDWGTGEHLAFASLLSEGVDVRLSGQDSGRGTFSHRHSIIIDQENGSSYIPLQNLKNVKGQFEVYNSPLSEYGVLGFEFGYSLSKFDPRKKLVIWEAQFGDFANGAQIMIDQFVASSEQKWGVRTNLVMLLPHGYAGGGSEHSSGRIERFLELSADENFRIANCTTPAQLYHILRRQVHNANYKPLVVFTPKEILRHPENVSTVQEFENGSFQTVIDDPELSKETKKLIFCSGKIYYDLKKEREKRENQKITLVRIEQLYPFDTEKVQAILDKYPDAKNVIWAQEEHQNMGAWNNLKPQFDALMPNGQTITYAGRKPSSVPAAGSHALHQKEYDALIQEIFN